MNITAVTLGVGPYHTMAVTAAERLEQRCNVPVYIAGDDDAKRCKVPRPHFLKFHLFDLVPAENILFFDPDIITMAGYDLARFTDNPALLAVRDMPHSTLAESEGGFLGFSPENYFNCGWLIVNRTHHRALFEQCKRSTKRMAALWQAGNRHKPVCRDPQASILYDQGILNQLAVKSATPVRLLDCRYNFMMFGSGKLGNAVKNLHSIHLLSTLRKYYQPLIDGQYTFLPEYEVDEPSFAALAGDWAYVPHGEAARRVTLRPDGTLADWPWFNFWFVDVGGELVLAELGRVKMVLQRTEADRWSANDGHGILHRL